MIVQRIRGIRSLLALAQAGLVTVLFWLCFAVLASFVWPGSAVFAGDYATDAPEAAGGHGPAPLLENWSLSLDLSIVLRTLWQMIRPPRTAV